MGGLGKIEKNRVAVRHHGNVLVVSVNYRRPTALSSVICMKGIETWHSKTTPPIPDVEIGGKSVIIDRMAVFPGFWQSAGETAWATEKNVKIPGEYCILPNRVDTIALERGDDVSVPCPAGKAMYNTHRLPSLLILTNEMSFPRRIFVISPEMFQERTNCAGCSGKNITVRCARRGLSLSFPISYNGQ